MRSLLTDQQTEEPFHFAEVPLPPFLEYAEPFIAPLPNQQHQESILTQIRLLGASVEELSLVSAHWFYLIIYDHPVLRYFEPVLDMITLGMLQCLMDGWFQLEAFELSRTLTPLRGNC